MARNRCFNTSFLLHVRSLWYCSCLIPLVDVLSEKNVSKKHKPYLIWKFSSIFASFQHDIDSLLATHTLSRLTRLVGSLQQWQNTLSYSSTHQTSLSWACNHIQSWLNEFYYKTMMIMMIYKMTRVERDNDFVVDRPFHYDLHQIHRENTFIISPHTTSSFFTIDDSIEIGNLSKATLSMSRILLVSSESVHTSVFFALHKSNLISLFYDSLKLFERE